MIEKEEWDRLWKIVPTQKYGKKKDDLSEDEFIDVFEFIAQKAYEYAEKYDET